MLKCNYCGCVIEDDELGTHEEDRGEFWGSPCSETVCDDCSCGGGFDEAKRCIECQEWFTDDELIYGYCKECLEEEMTYENAIKYGSENEESVAINGFLASCFSADEIQEILLKELTQAKELMPSRIDEYVKTYCKDDLYYFAEWLEVQDVI